MTGSPKFSVLQTLSQEADFSKSIPPFSLVDFSNPAANAEALDGNSTFILRSALRGEAGQKLNSGKSLSILNIRTSSDFARALGILRGQPALEEAILQKYVPVDIHFTAAVSNEMIFVEPTFEKSENDLLFLTKLTSVGQIPSQSVVTNLLLRLQARFPSQHMIVELGTLNGSVFLFQVNTVNKAFLGSLFRNQIFNLVTNHQKAWKARPGLFSLLRNEFKAWRTRKKFGEGRLAMNIFGAFRNWESILHYYSLFCMMERKKASSATWCLFLSAIDKPRYANAKKHFAIANTIAEKSSAHLPANFLSAEEALFVGNATLTGVVGEDFHLTETLDPKEIYEHGKKKIFLTMDSKVLGHGFLAAAETGTPVVGNLPRSVWQELAPGAKVRVDFKQREIQVI